MTTIVIRKKAINVGQQSYYLAIMYCNDKTAKFYNTE